MTKSGGLNQGHKKYNKKNMGYKDLLPAKDN